jgi:hypothetical protein
MSNRNIDKLVADIREGNAMVDDIDLDDEEVYVDGERLTNERADQLAADMLAKVRVRNLVPGGKSLSGGAKHSPAVQVVVSEITAAKLKEIAQARNTSVSKMLRAVLDEFVARETRSG